jgi:hypothetical protein
MSSTCIRSDHLKRPRVEGAADAFERGGNQASAPELDIESLHAEVGQLEGEKDL